MISEQDEVEGRHLGQRALAGQAEEGPEECIVDDDRPPDGFHRAPCPTTALRIANCPTSSGSPAASPARPASGPTRSGSKWKVTVVGRSDRADREDVDQAVGAGLDAIRLGRDAAELDALDVVEVEPDAGLAPLDGPRAEVGAERRRRLVAAEPLVLQPQQRRPAAGPRPTDRPGAEQPEHRQAQERGHAAPADLSGDR